MKTKKKLQVGKIYKHVGTNQYSQVINFQFHEENCYCYGFMFVVLKVTNHILDEVWRVYKVLFLDGKLSSAKKESLCGKIGYFATGDGEEDSPTHSIEDFVELEP